MRTSSPLDALVSPTVAAVLAATITQPERSWYMGDLAAFLRRRPSSLQRPLAGLTAAGILRRSRDGNRVYYQIDRDNPFFPELEGLILKTTGLVEPLRRQLRPFEDRIRVAFIYGSVARAAERPSSDVDLLVVGSVGLADLAPALRRAEVRIGRPVNAAVYTAAEFATRMARGGSFVSALADSEKIFVLGSADDLARVSGRRTR